MAAVADTDVRLKLLMNGISIDFSVQVTVTVRLRYGAVPAVDDVVSTCEHSLAPFIRLLTIVFTWSGSTCPPGRLLAAIASERAAKLAASEHRLRALMARPRCRPAKTMIMRDGMQSANSTATAPRSRSLRWARRIRHPRVRGRRR